MVKKRTKTKSSQEAVVEAAKEKKIKQEPIVGWVLSNGVKATLMPVPPALVQDVQLRIRDPQVPMWFNPDKERDEPNPVDPGYLSEKEHALLERTAAVMDAAIMFGVELEEGFEVPPSFIKRLKRLGIEFDENDPEEVEFRFKKYSVGTDDIAVLMTISGIEMGEEAARYRELFRSQALR